jgi:translation initiation factor IF-2
MVMDGKIQEMLKSELSVIVVVHAGELIALKRFKDDVKEVAKGYDCGIKLKDMTSKKEMLLKLTMK